jgi:hypothetical protein
VWFKVRRGLSADIVMRIISVGTLDFFNINVSLLVDRDRLELRCSPVACCSARVEVR